MCMCILMRDYNLILLSSPNNITQAPRCVACSQMFLPFPNRFNPKPVNIIYIKKNHNYHKESKTTSLKIYKPEEIPLNCHCVNN